VHAQLAQLAHMSAQLTVAKAASEKLASAEGTERVGLLKGGFVKGQWTKEEDELVCKYVELYGTKQWARIALVLPGRKGKQCRERWHNHLNPDISKDAWSNDEDLKLVEAHLVCAPTRILVPHRPRFPSSRALMLAPAEMKSWCARCAALSRRALVLSAHRCGVRVRARAAKGQPMGGNRQGAAGANG
jgi:hypothetical protein